MLWIIMQVGGALRQVATYLEECEQSQAVEGVDLIECSESGDGLSARFELTVSYPSTDGGAMDLCASSLNADGTLRLGFETTQPVVPDTTDSLNVSPRDATPTSDGQVRVEFTASLPSESSGSSDGTADTRPDRDTETDVSEDGIEPVEKNDPGGGDGRDRDVPPFKDPDLLESVYESCDTFAEMADTLEMDVTAETVRRYMIDYDIHEPNSYNTAPSDDGTTDPKEDDPVVLSDGIGLPEDITVDELIETVKQSNTIYEVKQDMGVDRQDALEMLRELNLLDLVVGRLATEAERDISRRDIVDRLRDASATQPAH